MSEKLSNQPEQKHEEYEAVRSALEEQLKNKPQYTDEFLAYYEKENPVNYRQLQSYLKTNKGLLSPDETYDFMQLALQKLDGMLANYKLDTRSIADSRMEDDRLLTDVDELSKDMYARYVPALGDAFDWEELHPTEDGSPSLYRQKLYAAYADFEEAKKAFDIPTMQDHLAAFKAFAQEIKDELVAEGQTSEPAASEKAPEVRVDYRKDARLHPEKYSQRTGDSTHGTLLFLPTNREAAQAIRVEDLYSQESDKKLILSNAAGEKFAYDNERGSWYSANGKRLAVNYGDVIAHTLPKSPAQAPEIKVTRVEETAPTTSPETPVLDLDQVIAPEDSVVEGRRSAEESAEDTGENPNAVLLYRAKLARDEVEGLEKQREKYVAAGNAKGVELADYRLKQASTEFERAIANMEENYVGDDFEAVAQANRLHAVRRYTA